MFRRAISLFGAVIALFLILAGTALACPDWRQGPTAGHLRYAGSDLWDAKAFDVVAGGDQYLDPCNIRHASSGERATGYVAYAPDFELEYLGGSGYQLELKVVSECDSTLLINTGGGNWYFDDDDMGNGDARICLTRPSKGTYDIWIGTYGSNTCNARFILESWSGGNCTR